ncbi:TPA: hypothetical protein DCQ44_03040 [Candidatus Taylorbacteria bacterium]|nr:hypothetical protein [Candidatus Taylorbacteria bacterium]
MKVLVFDDSQINRSAAQAQLKDHDLTVVGTYDEAQKLLTTQKFDAVLTDLLVPASDRAQGGGGLKYVGQEMPIGIFIGLLAAVKSRAKYVAVFTDSDHHSHPASACFDAFNDDIGEEGVPFTVEGCKVILCNARNWVNHFDPKELSTPLDSKSSDSVRAKNWTKLLAWLMREDWQSFICRGA